MFIKYTDIFHCNMYPPKFTQIWIFGLKIHHLATPGSGSYGLRQCTFSDLFPLMSHIGSP
jgi:hypothetical protein